MAGIILIFLSAGSRLFVAGHDAAARSQAGVRRDMINKRLSPESQLEAQSDSKAILNTQGQFSGPKTSLLGKSLQLIVTDIPGMDILKESGGHPYDSKAFPEGVVALTPTLIDTDNTGQHVTLSSPVREGNFTVSKIVGQRIKVPLRFPFSLLHPLLWPGLLVLGAAFALTKREDGSIENIPSAESTKKPKESDTSSLDTVISQAPPKPIPGPVEHDPNTPEDLIFGSFVKGKEIGRGSMGTVYLCRSGHSGDPNKYALKILGTEWTKGKDFTARFEREAAICLKLRHPNLVRAYQSGEKDGKLWMVMDFIEGRELTQWLKEKKHSERQIAELFQAVCAGLDYAHKEEIIHRDLKPSNIIVTSKSDKPVIADFGLACGKHYDTITKTNTTLGTPSYMPPEQITGGTGSPQGDLYSLGCIIHEALSGEPAFPGNDVLELLQKKIMGARPRSLTDDEASPEFRKIVEKLTAQKPGDRYQSAAEVNDAMESIK